MIYTIILHHSGDLFDLALLYNNSASLLSGICLTLTRIAPGQKTTSTPYLYRMIEDSRPGRKYGRIPYIKGAMTPPYI